MEFEEHEVEVECGKCGTYIVAVLSQFDDELHCGIVRNCVHSWSNEVVLEMIVEDGLVTP